MFKVQKPKDVIIENVKGFGVKRKVGLYTEETPLQVFRSRMQDIEDDLGRQLYTGSTSFTLDSDPWAGVKRHRLHHLQLLNF